MHRSLFGAVHDRLPAARFAVGGPRGARRGSSWWLAAIAATALLGLPGCDGGEGSGASRGAALAAGGGEAVRVDLDAIFPAGEGRELLLNNCQSCHTWVPVVVLQMREDEWRRWAEEHRGRVPGMSDAEFATLYSYLVANFNPERPVPELPPALLESWTSY